MTLYSFTLFWLNVFGLGVLKWTKEIYSKYLEYEGSLTSLFSSPCLLDFECLLSRKQLKSDLHPLHCSLGVLPQCPHLHDAAVCRFWKALQALVMDGGDGEGNPGSPQDAPIPAPLGRWMTRMNAAHRASWLQPFQVSKPDNGQDFRPTMQACS